MKGSKAVRTHLSTEKVENSFEKSAKERKASKNLYTLNKQSDDEISNETKHIDKNNEPEKGNRKGKNTSYQPQSSPSYQDSPYQSEEESHNIKTAGNAKIKLKLKQQKLNNHHSQSDVSDSEDEEDEVEQEERIQKYSYSDQNDKQLLKLHMTVKQLEQQNDLLNQSLLAHQNRQKDMIAKFAKLQAQNKRLQFEIIKISKTQKQTKIQQAKIKQTKIQIEALRNTNEQILAFIETQNMRIISYIKALVGKLIIQESSQALNAKLESKSIGEYLEKCMSTLKQNRKTLFKKFPLINESLKQNLSNNIQESNGQKPSKGQNQKQRDWKNFDFSYERQRILQLNEENSKLNNQIKKIKDQFGVLSDSYKKSSLQKENQIKEKANQIKGFQNELKQKDLQLRQQKGQICEKYNQAIEQLKGKYKTLQKKIEEQQEKYELKINELEKGLAHKDKVIRKLKEQLKEMNVKLQQIEEERFELHNSTLRQRQRQTGYHQSKKKYIDGDFLNSSLNSNKQKSFSKDTSLYKQPHHEQSFYEYQPEKRNKKNKWNEDVEVMMRKSHKGKKMAVRQKSLCEEEMDIEKLDKQIERLEREVLRQFENSS